VERKLTKEGGRSLVSTCYVSSQDVVLAEKPTISEETDLLEPALLDELICQISTLASVYHKPPSAFVEGKVPVRRITLQPRAQPYVICTHILSRHPAQISS
jgi:hypothetical protein